MKKNQIDPKYLRILGDSPISNAKFFNFDAYIEAIYWIIVHPQNTTPLSIVINGRWGSGKTSLMKTLRKKIVDHTGDPNARKVKTIWFNAWKYSETDAMLASLVREIYDEIDRENFFKKQGFFDRIKLGSLTIYEQVNTTQQITDLAKILTLGLAPDFTKWQKIPDYKKGLPFFDAFEKYMRLILNFFVIQEENGNYDDTKGALVIFIDDLDRCPPKSIAKILESINLFFDQKGCIFVFGMDTNLIAKAVKSHYMIYEGFSGEDYLKKMIQLQFDLPEIRKEDIKEYIESELAPDEALRNYIDLILMGSESNPRQIKQFINSLRFMMTLGDTIKRLKIDEELLIKWSILNLISGDLINKIKHDNHLLIRLQAYLIMDHEAFEAWDDPEFYLKATEEQIQKNYADILENLKDERIRKLLRKGKEFTKNNLPDYIFLSSLAPKESDYLGAITIVAEGDQTYYFGQKIQFFGTNTASSKVYLSITSQDFAPQNRKLDQLMVEAKNDDVKTFVQVDVNSDKTWQYLWDTSKVWALLKPGTHTIYASEGPITKDKLTNKAYGTVSIILKESFISATLSQSTIAQGDTLNFSGIAVANPKAGVQIWIFGENIFINRIVAVNSDDSYQLKLDRQDTQRLNPGQYFVVIQHPMLNDEFDVYFDMETKNVLSKKPSIGTQLFSVEGPDRKVGSDAAEALIDSINKPGIDDRYTKLQFLVEKPDISIDTIPDFRKGDKITISAQTNLAVDDEVLIEITSPDLDKSTKFPDMKTVFQTVVKVMRGDSGMNRISVDIDTSPFQPGKYMIRISAKQVEVEDHDFFNIIK